MSSPKKPLSPEELRAKQVAAQEQLMRKSREDAEQRAQSVRREQEAAANSLRATWYEKVEKAAENPTVRFVVIASVVGDPRYKDLLDELIADINQAGYKTQLVVEHSPAGDRRERKLTIAGMTGWHPGVIPQLGCDGGVRLLLVSW